MRILIDIRHLADRQRTGIGEYTGELLRSLFEIDRENAYELFSSGTRRPTAFPELERTHVSVPNKLLKLTSVLLGRPRIDRAPARRPDLLFFPNVNFSPVSPDVPYVLTVHDLSWKLFPEFFSWKMRAWHAAARPERLIGGATAIIVPSHATKEDLVRFCDKPASSIHVIPHGRDPIFSPDQRASDHGIRSRYRLPKRFALFVGTLEPRKNVVAIIRAMEEYRERSGDDLPLVLAGGWGWKSEEIQRALVDKPRIRHLGYVPREHLPALYRAATVFLWPSIYEGFGLPVLEAMASGAPVITSHTSSLPELTGTAAIHADPFNPRDIAVALEQLLFSPELRERLRQAGIERARQFSWDAAARATADVFRHAVDSAKVVRDNG